ncbi:hypothetical protein CC80DRAFT_210411 [Byssothecium circinans]|uniref:Uncharacterized protein n=1 Tax=Byssothecium circinans TaxID=147558 RepID=A0A6A5TFL6_9PLEO|nr:hypothetical protein CC80DRAFT_210411 [Byssothecium circinans]
MSCRACPGNAPHGWKGKAPRGCSKEPFDTEWSLTASLETIENLSPLGTISRLFLSRLPLQRLPTHPFIHSQSVYSSPAFALARLTELSASNTPPTTAYMHRKTGSRTRSAPSDQAESIQKDALPNSCSAYD